MSHEQTRAALVAAVAAARQRRAAVADAARRRRTLRCFHARQRSGARDIARAGVAAFRSALARARAGARHVAFTGRALDLVLAGHVADALDVARRCHRADDLARARAFAAEHATREVGRALYVGVRAFLVAAAIDDADTGGVARAFRAALRAELLGCGVAVGRRRRVDRRIDHDRVAGPVAFDVRRDAPAVVALLASCAFRPRRALDRAVDRVRVVAAGQVGEHHTGEGEEAHAGCGCTDSASGAQRGECAIVVIRRCCRDRGASDRATTGDQRAIQPPARTRFPS